MQQRYIKYEENNRRLILFFCGWSSDYHLIESLEFPVGYDILALWDYSNPEFSFPSKNYDESVVLAWSFGVAEASCFIRSYCLRLNITGRYAINGSPFPIEEERGISPEIFKNTIENLDAKNLLKFRIRICGGKNNYYQFSSKLQNEEDIETLRHQLRVFGDKFISSQKEEVRNIWDHAFISERDAIFQKERLIKAWEGTPFTLMKGGHHFIDFQYIINLTIKNKNKIRHNFLKNAPTYNSGAIVQKEISQELFRLWKEHQQNTKSVLEIGCGTGFLTELIVKGFHPERLLMIDLYGSIEEKEGKSMMIGDSEVLMPKLSDETFNSIASSSTVQWFHSPVKFLTECKRILTKNGVLAFSVFTSGTCKEINEITGNGLLYLSGDQWERSALNQGFGVLGRKDSEYKITFTDNLEMLRHLKHTGVSSLNGQNKFSSTIKKILTSPREQCQLSYISTSLVLEKL